MKMLLLFTSLFVCSVLFAQQYPGGMINVIHQGERLKNPWAGGFDMPQFSASDINNDNKKDLIVFDAKSNKWLIFLNEGNLEFKYAPQYEKLYPEVVNMGLIRDFNCDGNGDIFAHVNQGIQVFENTNVGGHPSFVQAKSLLEYQIGIGFNNIYKLNTDIAAVEDFDGDGDIDILSFDLLGTTIPYYRNLSVESGYGCDSLIFEENTICWGNFREGGLDNSIELDFSCKGNSGLEQVTPSDGKRHAGSTLAVVDFDEDNDKDLLIGDVSFNNLIYLENGGTNTTANMISVEDSFPIYNNPINVPIFPAAFYLDVNDDGKDDLLVSPNATTESVNKECVWYYENSGNVNNRFQLQQKDFLVSTQIDYGSYSSPVFFDHNADGLLDMIIGNGYIFDEFGVTNGSAFYYENTGTASAPEFTLVSENYALLDNFALEFIRPTFGDIDADGDDDMIVGEINGGIHLFLNNAGAGNEANFLFTTPNYFEIDIGTHSHPQLVDMNLDGMLDLVIGRNAPKGNVAYFRNIGTPTNPVFHPDTVNEVLGGIHVENPGFLFGFSSPFVSPPDAFGDRYLYVGSDLGFIHQYKINQDSLEFGTFVEVNEAILAQRAGKRTTIAINDINNDGALDFFVGNARGGVSFYSDALLDTSLVLSTDRVASAFSDFNLYPNPANQSVSISLDNFNRQNTTISVLDMVGKVYYQKTINGSKTNIDVSSFSKGVYFIQLESSSFKSAKKLLVY